MKRFFSLSPRLRMVADLIPEGTRLADIGTDHGRLPVWMLKTGRIRSAVATDLREKPLSRAMALAARWEVTDKISFRLQDGLAGICSDEADTVTIAGMGGESIINILTAAPPELLQSALFLLQPQSATADLRFFLCTHNLRIDKETAVREKRTVYVALAVRWGKTETYSVGELQVGRKHENEDNPLRAECIRIAKEKAKRALLGLSCSVKPEDMATRRRLEELLNSLDKLERECEG